MTSQISDNQTINGAGLNEGEVLEIKLDLKGGQDI